MLRFCRLQLHRRNSQLWTGRSKAKQSIPKRSGEGSEVGETPLTSVALGREVNVHNSVRGGSTSHCQVICERGYFCSTYQVNLAGYSTEHGSVTQLPAQPNHLVSFVIYMSLTFNHKMFVLGCKGREENTLVPTDQWMCLTHFWIQQIETLYVNPSITPLSNNKINHPLR